MEQFLITWFGELLVAGVLGGFAWAFKSWATSIKETSHSILMGQKELTREFHEHRILTERRVTRVETAVKLLNGTRLPRLECDTDSE